MCWFCRSRGSEVVRPHGSNSRHRGGQLGVAVAPDTVYALTRRLSLPAVPRPRRACCRHPLQLGNVGFLGFDGTWPAWEAGAACGPNYTVCQTESTRFLFEELAAKPG